MRRRVRRWLEPGIALVMTALAGIAGARDPRPGADAITWLALGDSYTIGEGVTAEARWPMQLARALRDDGIAIADPRIIATTGWTTDELSAALDDMDAGSAGVAPTKADPAGPVSTRDASSRTYGFVSLLIGVNDQYRGRGADDYRDAFAALLQRAIGYAGGRADRVLVLSIPDWGVTPFAAGQGRDPALIGRELDAYNAIAREACAQRDVAFVDVTPVSRERGAQPAMLVEDGLHPSAQMYAQWARLALPVARGLLAP